MTIKTFEERKSNNKDVLYSRHSHIILHIIHIKSKAPCSDGNEENAILAITAVSVGHGVAASLVCF